MSSNNTFQNGFIKILNDPLASISSKLASFTNATDAQFVLCNAGTKTSDLDGVSAAGHDALGRRMTPALDAEALLLGKVLSQESIPVSPIGIVSPVVISRACIGLLDLKTLVIDCGSFHSPQSDHQMLSQQPADCISTAMALSESLVNELFNKGLEIGQRLSESNSTLILAECVPGGTSTAMAVLSLLGYEVRGLLSSSLPNSNHEIRWALVQEALSKLKYSWTDIEQNPLLAVSSVGDPMQAVVAGIALGAAEHCTIYLAGGSQMLAVWALINKIGSSAHNQYSLHKENVIVLSTKWVAFDPSASVGKLANLTEANFAVSCPDFRKSKHVGLQAYEDGNVKEGVGAGALMCLAKLAGYSESEIINAIDDSYDQLVACKSAF